MAATRNILICMILLAFGILFYKTWQIETTPPPIPYSSFLASVDKNEITEVHIKGGVVTGSDTIRREFSTFSPDVENLIPRLAAKNVTIITEQLKPSLWGQFLVNTLPILLIVALWMFLNIKGQQGGKKSSFDKSKTSMDPKRRILFKDVAGIPEAKEELIEIVDFLKNPNEYTKLGGRIPKGVLLQGPPGTGKTLLAKAIAGEAGVPFFSISGSDFVEMFVGVGASRVRQLFKQAKDEAPCIIFIDEIDAVGRRRGAGADSAGGQDEREQTLNALLVEMDGFQSGQTVIIVAATNRPDILDPALLRPGRFDRQITILPPDVKGRQRILEIYGRKVVMSPDVDLTHIANITPGFTGAELANLVNEAALLGARKKKEAIDLSDLEEAKDKILMGTERKGMVISDKERRFTAYHEAGHAIVALMLPETDPVNKITIVPRGRAMGMTQQTPIDDRHAYSKEYLSNRIKTLLGGRTAEELVFNQYTTGASNDLQMATDIATKMICEWGMCEKLGPRAYIISDEGFLGNGGSQRIYSEDTAHAIDMEINQLIENCYQEAMIILEGKRALLDRMAEILLTEETIDADEIKIITSSSCLIEGNIGIQKTID
ncbi:MAG: ATP-dependent zinc metalloprotease FtsH [Desulfobulbaceae bacterium]|nr:ATP-dependent zinc metalloprotease FtsH [Desulfobulbaceae bacterium]